MSNTETMRDRRNRPCRWRGGMMLQRVLRPAIALPDRRALASVPAILTLTAMLIGLTGMPGPLSAQSLKDALAAAYGSNPTLLAARARLRATDENVASARGGWRPDVRISGNAGASRQHGNRVPKKVTTHPYGARLTVTQPLYNGGDTVAAIAAAEARSRARRFDLSGQEQGIFLAVVTAYMDVVRAQSVVDLNRHNETRLRRRLEATQDRFEVGELTRTDVAQAESRLARSTANLIRARGELEISRAAYEAVVGTPPGRLVNPAMAITLPASQPAAVDQALANNPLVDAAVHDWRAAMRDVERARAGLLPSLSLVGEAARQRQEQAMVSSRRQFSLTAQFNIPLYQQGVASSGVRASRQRVSAARARIDEARRTARDSAARAWESYRSSLAEIEAVRQEEQAARVALDGVEQEAGVGQRTVLEVLDAEQELLDAQVRLVRAERDVQVNGYGLLAAVGAMTADGLDLPVARYDAEAYYLEVRDRLWGGAIDADADSDMDAETDGQD